MAAKREQEGMEGQESGGLVEPLPERPVGEPLEKGKVTYTLDRRLIRQIAVVASELRIQPCELVDRVMKPALAGYRAPTIPAELRAIVNPKKVSAV